MRALQAHRGIAAPLPIAHVDTDQILPARFLRKPREAGYGRWMFHDLRFDGTGALRPEFVLNRPPFDRADILVAGRNFGCGSSREGAVYALVDYGFRAILAPGFGDIFHTNALKNGLLAIRLADDLIAAVQARLEAEPGAEIAIDLQACTLDLPGAPGTSFDIDPVRRDCILRGVDELDLTRGLEAEIAAFEAAHGAAWPWVRPPAGEGAP